MCSNYLNFCGLQETFKNNLILKKNNHLHLYKKIQFLINNKKLLYYQKQNFNNVIHDIVAKSKILDDLIPRYEEVLKKVKILNLTHIYRLEKD